MQSKTFCVAPWFQIRNENLGDLKPCCQIDPKATEWKGSIAFNSNSHTIETYMDSEWMQHLRNSLASGQQAPECHRCWKNEDSGVISERQLLNEKLKIDTGWASIYFKKYGIDSWSVMSADWKHNNICNLGCVMCSPIDSSILYSQWLKNKDHPIVQSRSEKFDRDWKRVIDIFTNDTQKNLLQQLLDQPNLRWLKILGGEPLIYKSLLNQLSNLSTEKKKRIHLHFITNATQDMALIAEDLRDYRELTFSVSLDGTNAIQEWIRAGSSWSTVETNVLNIKDQHSTYVHCVLQAVNFPWLYDLWNWCVINELALDIALLENPKPLSISILDINKRSRHLDDIEKKLIATKIRNHDRNILEFKNIRSQILSMPYIPNLIEKFHEYVQFHDLSNGSDSHGIVENW